MNAKEAGRLGGLSTVAKYGREHMATIGSIGGKNSTTRFQKGEIRVREIASRGGKASGGNFARNLARAREAGKKGGLTKSRNKQAKAATFA